MYGEEGKTNLANKGEHVARNVAFCKPSAGICEEILPLALERVVVGAVAQPWVVF
jgi:hypothetical protein